MLLGKEPCGSDNPWIEKKGSFRGEFAKESLHTVESQAMGLKANV